MTLSLHTTPGTPAAFDFQFERALYWLAKSPAGSVTGIETDDDVAIRGGDGSRVLEQDKHSIQQTSKPFGDRSHDLWNTLAIWIDALDNNEVQGSSIHFLMVTNKSVPDCIAHQIGRASTDDEITACITALEAASQKPTKELTGLMQSVAQTGFTSQPLHAYPELRLCGCFCIYVGSRFKKRNNCTSSITRLGSDAR
jgi:hypothetical protein